MESKPIHSAHLRNIAQYNIGDAVVSTDLQTQITYMNPVAELLTGWKAAEALDKPLDTVFHIVNQETRQTVESSVAKLLRDGSIVSLANHTALIARDGTERPIEYRAGPIRDEAGTLAGSVLVFRDISDRSQYEQQLRGAFDYVTNIIATLRQPFLILDKNLRVVSANRSFFQAFQVTHEETHGQLVYDLGNRQWDIPALKSMLDGVLSNNHPILDFEVDHDFPTLGKKSLLLNALRVRKPGNHSELILLAIEDVTNRKRTEVTVRRNAETFAKLVDQSPFGIYTVDSRFRIAQVSAGALPAFRNVKPLIGRDFGDAMHTLWPEPFASEAIAIFRHTLETGDPYVAPSLTEKRQDIEDVESYEWQIHRVTLPDGQYGVVCYFFDSTRIRQAEQRVKRSEQRYRRLFEMAQDGILILDADTMRIVDANPFMEELLGYSREQFIDKELWEIGLFQDKNESQTAVRTLKETGYIRYDDLPLESRHGIVQEVEFICNVYSEEDHNVAQCNIRNITRRKQMERRIQDQAMELAAANRRKDEFLAMLSHELRNPMAPMFNALQLIGQEGNETDLHREARGVIERQVRHLARLTDDLLEVSRITTGRVSLHTERVDVNGIVKGAVERLLPQIDRRQQNLTVTLAEEVIWLEADAARLEQVFGNLLNNASKYNNPGGRIWLSVSSQDQGAVIRVKDSGIGMAPDLLPIIFDLFTQADKSLDRTEGGLGIGLALVKSLVELHRGTVTVHSEGIGTGSELIVWLPVAPEGQARRDSAPAQSTPTAAESLRVLVVDDNVDAAKMSAMLIRSWGHEVRTAYDGPEALQRVTGFLPHVILCDIGLPQMDGYEVARHIRQNPQLKGVMLVAVTGYGQDSDRQLSKEAGFDLHMVKPVDSDDLQKLLAKLQPRPNAPSFPNQEPKAND